MRKEFKNKAERPMLDEATIDAVLDNIEKYEGSTIVIKFGGEMIANEQMLDDILRQSITLKRHKVNVILVHGGGTQIDDDLAARGIQPGKDEVTGKRMCDETVVDVAYDTLRRLNKEVVQKLNTIAKEKGRNIVGMGESGYNGALIRAVPMHENTRTGNFEMADAEAFKNFASMNKIPVIYPICMGPDNETLNVNADDVAAGIASATGASRLIMVTDVPGVWDKNRNPIEELTIAQVNELIADGTISGGMKPKVEAAMSVAKKGINVVITTPKNDGLLNELFTEKGSGTMILSLPKEERLLPEFLRDLNSRSPS